MNNDRNLNGTKNKNHLIDAKTEGKLTRIYIYKEKEVELHVCSYKRNGANLPAWLAT